MARCQCAATGGCDCFVVDDGATIISNAITVINNNSTLVRGTGEFFQPYSVDGIHDPNFQPPAARAFKNKALMSAGLVTFDGSIVNTEGMFNTNTPDRLIVQHEGLYAVGFDVAFETQNNAQLSTFEYSAFITQHYSLANYTVTCDVVKHRYFETTSIWPLTVRSTQSKVLPTYIYPGDYFTLHTFTSIATLSTQASMWICYI